jgi:hypothetical protein
MVITTSPTKGRQFRNPLPSNFIMIDRESKRSRYQNQNQNQVVYPLGQQQESQQRQNQIIPSFPMLLSPTDLQMTSESTPLTSESVCSLLLSFCCFCLTFFVASLLSFYFFRIVF